MNGEIVQLVSIHRVGRRSRWHGPGVSACLARFETGAASQKHSLGWDRVLGLATVLVVVVLGWAAVGFAIYHFLK